MSLRSISGVLMFALLVFGISLKTQAQQNAYRISTPFTYKNLTVFLIHGKSEMNGKNILTLQEAMEQKILVVYETSDVNELIVENKSSEFEVFIQSGDIVKGGKQDRVLAIDLILSVRSGRVSISAFCVESGRWKKRGGESSSEFSSSNERIVTKDLKLAANKARSQGEVWKEVEKAQTKLSQNVGSSVNAADSRTSLQLSLENGKVVATAEEYVKKMQGIINGKSDVIGYAFVINGELNSADVYGSSELFKKLWLKLLRATAIEAVAEFKENAKFSEMKADKIEAFLDDAEKGKSEEKTITTRVKLVTKEDKDNILFESRDEKRKVVIHKSYVKKQ